MKREHEKLVNELAKELEAGNLAIFAGAGLSRQAGFVDWKELLKPIAIDLDLDIEEEVDLVALAQYHANSNAANRNKLNQLLVNEFSRRAEPTENHEVLARLPISTYWTTNYDHLIEDALKKTGKIPDVKHRVTQLPLTVPKRDALVYKMHGDVDHASEAVLTRDDYERYHLKMAPFVAALAGDLVAKTFLFLGFSFTDPNLDYILSRVRIAYAGNQRQSYCILRSVAREEGEDLARFEYRERKQDLFRQELLRFGIKVFYVKEFSEITDILKALEDKYRRRSVFISGAAHDYSPFSPDEATRFVFDLAGDISKADYRILSGFGLGVGSAVIAGVVEATAMGGRALDEDCLLIRPFPQDAPGRLSRAELWKQYRIDILKRAGVAIFLFGNKLENDGVVLSSGMDEEFQIALENDVFVIPVGITGGTSRVLWERTMEIISRDEIKLSDELKESMVQLGSDEIDLTEARKIILRMLKMARR